MSYRMWVLLYLQNTIDDLYQNVYSLWVPSDHFQDSFIRKEKQGGGVVFLKTILSQN